MGVRLLWINDGLLVTLGQAFVAGGWNMRA